ncbi:MAG TPA: hypothetical protein DCX54_13800 [Flavobacteriales bacterium]|nr:hypothetical protein [Flavobacteriales bacterium]
MDTFFILLKTLPPTAWTALITAILTSGITLTGVALSNKENRKRLELQFNHEKQIHKENILRERGEELYVSILKYTNFMVSDHSPYAKVMKGDLEYNQALDLTIESANNQKFDAQRITMLTNLYFPSLKNDLDILINFNGEIMRSRKSFELKYKDGYTQDESLLNDYLSKIHELSSMAKDIECKVIDVIKKL